MTFVEIESKRRPCSFLSNNVKNDVNTARFYLSLVSLVVSQTKQGEKISLHLFKHKSVRRRWAGGDIIMKIICSYQKSGTRKAAGKELSFKSSKHKQGSQCVILVGSEPVTELLHIKAGFCGGSAPTCGFTAQTPLDAKFVAHDMGNSFYCCIQTHMWNALKLLMGRQTWQKPSWIMILS